MGSKGMVQCGLCNNMVPEGRVVTRCDGCLALHYYGNALDEILKLTDEDNPVTDFWLRKYVDRIARKAVRAVPRREPGPRYRIVSLSEGDSHPARSLSASDYVRAGEGDAAAIEAAYVEQGLGRIIDGVPDDLVRLPSFVQAAETSATVAPIVVDVLSAKWYEIGGHLFASRKSIGEVSTITPADMGFDPDLPEMAHISGDEFVKSFDWGNGLFFYK